MGFPASLGAPFIPYIILDGVVAPRSSSPGPASEGEAPSSSPVTAAAADAAAIRAPLVSRPCETTKEFSEAIVRLRHTYFGNSYKDVFPVESLEIGRTSQRPGAMMSGGDISPAEEGLPVGSECALVPTRAQEGLPEEGVVFACFNQIYKLDPETLSTW